MEQPEGMERPKMLSTEQLLADLAAEREKSARLVDVMLEMAKTMTSMAERQINALKKAKAPSEGTRTDVVENPDVARYKAAALWEFAAHLDRQVLEPEFITPEVLVATIAREARRQAGNLEARARGQR